MRIDGTSVLFGLGAFTAPFVASQLFTGNLAGKGQGIPKAGEIGTLRSMTLAAGIATAIYAFSSKSSVATAIAGGLVGSSAAMFLMPAAATTPKQACFVENDRLQCVPRPLSAVDAQRFTTAARGIKASDTRQLMANILKQDGFPQLAATIDAQGA